MADLDSFMYAISATESGHDYSAVGPQTSSYGRALGRYQIMSKIWPGWAAEAGIPGADWRDPANQDRVARYKMSQYRDRYGSWDLAAIAWFAGPGRAQTAKEQGIDAVGGISDVLGTDVRTYVAKMNSNMGGGQAQGGRIIEGTEANVFSQPDPVTGAVHVDDGSGAQPTKPEPPVDLVSQQAQAIAAYSREED